MSWFQDAAGARMFISVITLMEIEIGVRRVERADPTRGAMLRFWKADRVECEFRHFLLPVTETIADGCAALHVPDPRSPLDSLIAATAIVHEKTLVTRNLADFRGMPFKLINPWE